MDYDRFFLFFLTIIRASSVLQRNTKLYGPQNALDIHNSTSCWNSEGLTSTSVSEASSWMIVRFPATVNPTEIRVQFQAGFGAHTCHVYGWIESQSTNSQWELLDDSVAWSDSHELQSHVLQHIDGERKRTKQLKIVFHDTTDFYGRITIYRLEIWGQKDNLVVQSDSS